MKTEASKMLITFVLDKSGSMGYGGVKEATIEAFNAYVTQLRDDLKRDGGIPIDVTLLQFDSPAFGVAIEKTFFETPIESVPLLSDENYRPRGGTPLIDAALTTIEALEKAVEAKADKPKVVVCIQTDGQENSSKRQWSELKEKIAQKIAEGWQFNFMGAGIDAYDQGSRMGIGISNTISYDSSDLGATRAAFTASAMNAGTYRTGMSADTSYSTLQKMAAGDAYDPTINAGKRPSSAPPVQTTVQGTPSFDLTNGFQQPTVASLDLTQGLQLGVVQATGTATRRHDAQEKGLDLTSE